MTKGLTTLRYITFCILMFTQYAFGYSESPLLKKMVKNGELPPVESRLPKTPRIIDYSSRNLSIGKYGGTIKMLMARAKDARQMTVYGYARLLIFKPKTFEFQPDILESFDVIDGKKFIFNLRPGHKWSDGHRFSTEDFRYWWEDVANNTELSPVGPPKVMKVEGQLPQFRVLNELTIEYEWEKPNPDFLVALAGASPLYIYRPAHYMRQFHRNFVTESELQIRVSAAKQRNWAALHNKMDNLYRNDNINLPVLQPWVCVSKTSSNRLRFKRNPYFHRIDPSGQQLPYVDEFVFGIASNKLISAKSGTGEVDLQARYLRFDDYTFLKKGEDRSPYSTRLWPTAKGSHLALFPNLNHKKAELRSIIRDVRFRRALSMAVNRYEINQVIYYGLAIEGNNTVLPESPLYKPYYRSKWAKLDLTAANQLLDDMGLTQRDNRGIRLMPDGNPLNLIVETAGESTEQTDILELIHDSWLKIGVKIYSKPSQRNVFRNRIFSGETSMSIWSGIENGLATANSSPAEFAPTTQQLLQWPKWGQNFETEGKAGQPVDDPEAQELLELYKQWRVEPLFKKKEKIWAKILAINTEQVYSIGLIARVLQPVVVSNKLKNVPLKAIYNWNPGAHFGIYSPDTFWFKKSNKNTLER
ncbi:MAG: ABC transporter substrate-binding protein [Rhodospirillaceae bacterium]|nr:ABC transporter substrate-binding protein [Rhodospirillaceae bacterium]MBT6306888.1 ABC transporter substrate-binding protein [Rhodospirillaceae bacterium]MBT7732911.1 ABC transporter substrate-binding protein [Rhodospirillaceae bacterium]MDC0998986.1 ABC transporter substrate-binding protein [Alphaproteobacteria bacterium]